MISPSLSLFFTWFMQLIPSKHATSKQVLRETSLHGCMAYIFMRNHESNKSNKILFLTDKLVRNKILSHTFNMTSNFWVHPIFQELGFSQFYQTPHFTPYPVFYLKGSKRANRVSYIWALF